MAQVTFSVRMDEDIKNEFSTLCDSFGMSMTTAINVFAKAVIREKKIPFEISAISASRKDALDNFLEIRKIALSNRPDGMTLEQINTEIDAARKENENICRD